jgi:hypothetical protein
MGLLFVVSERVAGEVIVSSSMPVSLSNSVI